MTNKLRDETNAAALIYSEDTDSAFIDHIKESAYLLAAFNAPTVSMLVEALKASGCETVMNHEGSGMFNKHDPNCRKCKALADFKQAKGES